MSKSLLTVNLSIVVVIINLCVRNDDECGLIV